MRLLQHIFLQPARLFARGLLDLVSPPDCVLCHKPTHRGRRALCWECLSAQLLPVDAAICSICGVRFYFRAPLPMVCGPCDKAAPAFESARAAVYYRGMVRHLIQIYKYNKAVWLYHDFADWLHAAFLAHYAGIPFDLVVPVPLDFIKLRQRHYNQSALIAGELAKRLGLPFAPKALGRTRRRSSQTRLTRRQRFTNAAGAFSVRQPGRVNGKTILLIDDVFTTGATTGACAKALRAAGAKSIRVLTVARGE